MADAMPAPDVVAAIPGQFVRQPADPFAYRCTRSLVFQATANGPPPIQLVGETPTVVVGPVSCRVPSNRALRRG